MVSLFQRPNLSKVNARHLLDDLASSYTYSLGEAVLVELVANAMDAGASTIMFQISKNDGILSIQDDGQGMDEEEFVRYHDLAESKKEKGKGIGFAGLGAKLAHKIAKKIVTETRSEGYHGASEWQLRRQDLEWRHVRARALSSPGTRVTLSLDSKSQRLMTRRYVEDVVHKYFAPLLDPYISELFRWESIYPGGVAFTIAAQPMSAMPIMQGEGVLARQECDIYDTRKRRIGRAIFALADHDLPEDSRGVFISTYGKLVRSELAPVQSQHPERVVVWFESPQLVECLTLNKQDFVVYGSAGEKYRRIKRLLYKSYSTWLAEVGEATSSERQQRAPRALQQETAKILLRIPQLRYLFSKSIKETVVTPDTQGKDLAEPTDSIQAIHGESPGGGGGEGIIVSPGPNEGQGLLPFDTGSVPVRAQSRRVRSGPGIVRRMDAGRDDMAWVEGDNVVINTAHPAYIQAERRRLLAYHERVAVYYALCQEAAVEPEEKLSLLNRALTEWGRN